LSRFLILIGVVPLSTEYFNLLTHVKDSSQLPYILFFISAFRFVSSFCFRFSRYTSELSNEDYNARGNQKKLEQLASLAFLSFDGNKNDVSLNLSRPTLYLLE